MACGLSPLLVILFITPDLILSIIARPLVSFLFLCVKCHRAYNLPLPIDFLITPVLTLLDSFLISRCLSTRVLGLVLFGHGPTLQSRRNRFLCIFHMHLMACPDCRSRTSSPPLSRLVPLSLCSTYPGGLGLLCISLGRLSPSCSSPGPLLFDQPHSFTLCTL